jgi:isochorismate hydrolase
MGNNFLNEVRRYNIRRATIQPDRCALLVIDMQNYFASIAADIETNVLEIIDVCRSAGMPILFTRHGHKNLKKDGGMLDKWWGDNIRYGTPHWRLLPSIVPAETDIIIDKNRYSAFFNTSLDETLRNKGIEQVLISGVLTNCCCETTAREAFVRDYRVFFVSDATATVNEELHLASLKNLAYGFAHIVRSDEVCGSF